MPLSETKSSKENSFLVFVARVTMVPSGKQHLPKNRLSDKSTLNPFLAIAIPFSAGSVRFLNNFHTLNACIVPILEKNLY